MSLYFSYDECGEFVTHGTAEAAKSAAEAALDYCRDEACDGWNEEVVQICWGEIKGAIIESERRPSGEQDACYPECDEVVDYALKEVE